MLLNLVHLLPDLSGAVICPKERLVAVSDPLHPADSSRRIAETVRGLIALVRQRRPARLIWLGASLPHLLAAGKVENAELDRLMASQPWSWVADSLPAGLPGDSGAEVKAGGLTFRHRGQPLAGPGEISASPWPLATCDGRTWPCFVVDGRRLVLPAFGPRGDGGTDVLAPPLQSLFRRPFQVLMLADGRIVTRPRARLDGAAPASAGSGGRRMSLFGETS